MTELMPQHRFPVGRGRHLRGRTVGGNNAAKTHAQKSWVIGHAKGAYTEILLFGKNLHGGGLLQLEGVLFTKGFMGTIKQAKGPGAVNLCFMRVHAQDEVCVGQGGIFTEGILQCDEVKGGDIIPV